MVYQNTRDNYSTANLAAKHRKAVKGEEDVRIWCMDRGLLFEPATKDQDYKDKFDCKIEKETINIKANYNSNYDSFWVETELINKKHNWSPEAWLNHDIDGFAFVIDADEVYVVHRRDLIEHLKWNEYFSIVTDRYKGKYRIVALPKMALQVLNVYKK